MEEVPLLKALHMKYADQGVVILGISIDDTVARAAKTISEKGMVWPQIAEGKGADGEIVMKYGVQGTPTVFVLDRDGRIVGRPPSAAQIEHDLPAAIRRP